MDILKNIKAHELKIERTTIEKKSEEVILLEDAFFLLGSGFSKLKYQDFEKLMLVRSSLLSNNFSSFRVCIQSTKKGYYLQSLSLIRNIYENWLSFWYLIQFPEDVDRWLDPSWEQRPPGADVMRRKMDHPSNKSSKQIHELATELHRFAHTDPVAVLNQIDENGDEVNIRIGQKYDSEKFDACVYALSFWLGMNLDALESLIPNEAEWKQKHISIGDEIGNFMDKYNKKFNEL